MTWRRTIRRALLAAVSLSAAPATAVTDLAGVGGVADISIDLDGTLAGPQRVVLDDAQGGVTVLDLGDLPPGVRITAYAQTTDGAELAINELILIVNIALGQNAPDTCAGADRNGDGAVAINEIIAAVNEALAGCPPAPAARGVRG